MATEPPPGHGCLNIKGVTVVNDQGDDLGKIEAIMLDVTTGRIAYAVLSFGGFLGMGNKLFAIPWSALDLGHGSEMLHPERAEGAARQRTGIRQGSLALDG